MSKIIHEVNPELFNDKLAEALKSLQEFDVPEWAEFVKSGSAKERPPVEDDFWYKRAASILRQLYIKGVVGVGKLRTRYGSKKARGGRPSRFRKGSGKIIRVILQQAEKAGLVEKIDKIQFGRRLSQHGRAFLDDVAKEMLDSMPEVKEVKSVEKVEEKKVEEIKQEVVEDAQEEEVGSEEVNEVAETGEEDGKVQ